MVLIQLNFKWVYSELDMHCVFIINCAQNLSKFLNTKCIPALQKWVENGYSHLLALKLSGLYLHRIKLYKDT